jgi:preprotein translocase subunit SecE
MNRIVTFLKDVRVELAKVSWPTRRQTVQYTGIVVLMSVLVAAFLGAWDGFFGFILNKLLIK